MTHRNDNDCKRDRARRAGSRGPIPWTGLAVGVLFAMFVAPSVAAYSEAPSLSERVKAQQLPPVAERLPRVPHRLDLAKAGKKVGRYGGDLRLLMSRTKDVRLMVVYGYARLVGYDDQLKLVPDILESVDVVDNRVFTLHLREGHRWSDGHPFTTEAFRYYWEDIANNEQLAPFGLNQALLVEGKPPKFEVLDAVTVRYSWPKPNPYFLSAIAGTQPLYIYAPGHFLRQFHARYALDSMKLEGMAKAHGQRNWAALHNRMDSPYKNAVPNMPTLQPWVNTTRGPSQRFLFVRNPYFHRVDQQGQQLPYLGRVVMNIADKKLIPAKTGAGESDLQARGLSFSDYSFLKQNEKRSKLQVRLWQTTKGSHIALYPNLNAKDEQWRQLNRDVRFRHALSMGIDRHEINQVIYQGFATEGNNTVHKKSPLYKAARRTKWATLDLKRANRLLDEIGLTERDGEGLRLLPDGRPMKIVVETAGESTEQVDLLELIHDTWLKLGIKVFTKPIQREVFRNRIFAGETVMSVWGGLENGVPNAGVSPLELAPTSQQQLQWPKWGQYYQDKGKAGEPPDLPEAIELLELQNRWANATTHEEQAKVWNRMLDIHAEETFTIGIIAAVPQPVVSSAGLRNVPKKGIYNWEPGAHFGIYHPDTFWLAN